MYYSTIKEFDIANGEGVRVSIFVSGCKLHCKGCFNYDAWDFKHGIPFTKETIYKILNLLDNCNIKGLSILGGEPMDENNQRSVADLIHECKKYYPTKDIWLWTGYTIKELLHDNKTPFTEYILNNVEVVIDGRFDIDKKDLSLKWRGSSNQEIHENYDHNIIYHS